MPEYSIGVLVEGWVKLQVSAPNREELMRTLNNARVMFGLVDEQSVVIAKVVDSADEEVNSIFTIEHEDIEICKRAKETKYYLAKPEPPMLEKEDYD